jgi:hypothetical protein
MKDIEKKRSRRSAYILTGLSVAASFAGLAAAIIDLLK